MKFKFLHFNYVFGLLAVFFSFTLVSCDDKKSDVKKQINSEDSKETEDEAEEAEKNEVSFRAGAMVGPLVYFRGDDHQFKYQYDPEKNTLTTIDFNKPAEEYHKGTGDEVHNLRLFTFEGGGHAFIKDHFYIGFSSLPSEALKEQLANIPTDQDMQKKVEKYLEGQALHRNFVIQVLAGGVRGSAMNSEQPSVSYGEVGSHRYIYYPDSKFISIDAHDETKVKSAVLAHYINGSYEVYTDKENSRAMIVHCAVPHEICLPSDKLNEFGGTFHARTQKI